MVSPKLATLLLRRKIHTPAVAKGGKSAQRNPRNDWRYMAFIFLLKSRCASWWASGRLLNISASSLKIDCPLCAAEYIVTLSDGFTYCYFQTYLESVDCVYVLRDAGTSPARVHYRSRNRSGKSTFAYLFCDFYVFVSNFEMASLFLEVVISLLPNTQSYHFQYVSPYPDRATF